MTKRTQETLVLIGWMVAAAMTRLIPHPANFTPVAAIALFGGAHFRTRRNALAVALGSMLISDALLGFHDQMIWVYGSIAATVWIGGLLRNRKRFTSVVTASLISSVLFFVVTNFGVWATAGLYPRTVAGLFGCFVAAIPFFGRTVLGDLCYAGVLFGGFAWAGAKLVATRSATPCSGASATR
jgi:hypothetical protein